MPRKSNYGYGRGQGQTQQDLVQLRNVNLPPKMKCYYCNKSFNQANFSQKQLDDVRYQIKNGGRIVTNPKCNKCTGGRLFEFDCIMCHKTGGENDFSKTQRKTPDNAICYSCIDLQVKQEPVNEEDYEDPNRAFLTGDHSRGNYPDYFAPASTHDASIDEYDRYTSTDDGEEGGISLANLNEALIEGDFYPPPDNTSDPWKEVGAKSYQTTSKAMSGVTVPATSRTGTGHTFNSSAVEQSNKSGFAKIKAYKPVEEETPTPFDSDSDSDNYDSDDDDDDDDDTVI